MKLCLQYFGEDASPSKILPTTKIWNFAERNWKSSFQEEGKMLEMEFNARLQGSQKSFLQLVIIVQCSYVFSPLFLHHSFHWHPFTGITSSKFISGERLLCQNISYSFLCLKSCQFRWDRSKGGDCQFLSWAFASKRLKSWPCHSSRTPYCFHIEDFKIPLPVLVPCWGDWSFWISISLSYVENRECLN